MATLYNLLWYPALPFVIYASGGRDENTRRERLGAVALADAAQGTP